MPLDGIVVKNIIFELNNTFLNARIDKIYQPAIDEIVLNIRAGGRYEKLFITSNASFPRIHMSTGKFENPPSPPVFCMTLRKHLSGGKITGFNQPYLERIVEIEIEAINEMGDLSKKKLVLEIMGKHSNIILLNEEGRIVDAVRRVGIDKSSVRQVLPGRDYVYPPNQGKINPLTASAEDFFKVLNDNKSAKASDAIYKSFCGISPLIAVEICVRGKIIPGDYLDILPENARQRLCESFNALMSDCRLNRFSPEIIYENDSVLDFSSLEITQLEALKKVRHNSISELLEQYYSKKSGEQRLKNKTSDLRKLLQNNIERCVKKNDVLQKTARDAENMEEWRICGELLTSYMSLVPSGAKYYDAENYYDGNNIKRIKLKDDLSPAQNAARYFDKYNKAKRQKKAVTEQLSINEDELKYLEGVYGSVFMDISENEIQEIRQELFEQGYIKRNPAKKGIKQKKSTPMHFVSSDGFDIFVGKNNRQNDELTFKLAVFNDIWLHTKDIPGSHVILKTNGIPPTDTALNEAAHLAAFYSKARDGVSIAVDYTQKRNVKKPNGAKPGMVIYDKYKTAYITPDKELINAIKQGLL